MLSFSVFSVLLFHSHFLTGDHSKQTRPYKIKIALPAKGSLRAHEPQTHPHTCGHDDGI